MFVASVVEKLEESKDVDPSVSDVFVRIPRCVSKGTTRITTIMGIGAFYQLIVGTTTPVSKAPFKMTPTKLQELKESYWTRVSYNLVYHLGELQSNL